MLRGFLVAGRNGALHKSQGYGSKISRYQTFEALVQTGLPNGQYIETRLLRGRVRISK